MTRNEQLLLIMSWARSFHGLSLEDCETIAEEVLDKDFSGDIGKARPSAVITAFDKRYFIANSEGRITDVGNNAPRWEDHGVVRPPQIENDVCFISDMIIVDVNGFFVARNPVNVPFNSNQTGIRPDGSLKLNNGSVVPPLSDEDRSVIWPIVFSDPVGHTQKKIDKLVAKPPRKFKAKTYVEKMAVKAYNHLYDLSKEIENQHQHTHHSH